MLTENLKSVLPAKLWKTAETLISHYRNKGYTVNQLSSIDDDYRYRVHLICKKRYDTFAIEIREKCNVEKPFENFVIGCQAKRVSVRVFFAVPEVIDESETLVSHSQRNMLKKLGIGLITIGANGVNEDIGTISCYRRFALEPGSSLGKYSAKVDEIIADYNLGNCLDAVRDLCEEVEDATISLALKAAKKGKIAATVDEINNHEFDWAGLINGLSIRVWRNHPQTQIINDRRLKNSLDNFRDKRNLSDHRKTPKQLRELEQQYPEAMLQGIRLLRELVRINNQLR